jgi:hypothetical protein
MKTIFTKPIGKSLTGSSKRHKKKEGGKNMKINPRVYAWYVLLAQNIQTRGHFMPKGQRIKYF